ncbi:MAG: large conductance mechanosensitive channel protein MscL [Patescibacteria group bacterium]
MIQKTRGFWSEFRSFAVKGNAFELAIAVVVGNAFSGVVNSLVGDILTPLLGMVTNNVDFKTLAFAVRPEVVVKYGAFLQALFNFLLISGSIFIVFKLITAARKRLFREQEATPPHEKPAQERLLEEIRDLLKEKGEVV